MGSPAGIDGRELRFRAVVNDAPGKLTQDQIARFNAEGYLKPFRIFDPEEVAANRRYFDGLLAGLQQMGDGRDEYALNGYHDQCRGLYDLVTDPRILAHVADLCGHDFVCWGSHFFCKLPGDARTVPWHQDAPYWPFDSARTITAWLAIDDADVGNGAMQVVPRSHLLGQLDWRDAIGPTVLPTELLGVERYGRPVPFELRAGEISLHADLLAHGSPANHSMRRRCGLTIRYCPVAVRAGQSDWNAHSILCRGRDPAGYWANVPRPAGEDLTSKAWQRAVRAG